MVDGDGECDLKLEEYFVSEECGFLLENPLESLPPYFEVWNELGRTFWTLCQNKTLRPTVLQMPLLDYNRLQGHKEHRLAHLLLSMIGAGYVWQEGDQGVTKSVPKNLAVPWCGVSEKLGIQPVVGHTGIALANWKKIDPLGPCDISNIDLIFKYPAGTWNCGWFMRVTVLIELQSVSGIKCIVKGIEALKRKNVNDIKGALNGMTDCLQTLKKTFAMMHDLDASHFYNIMRPFLNGWGGASSPLPEGLIYDGVDTTPKQCVGGSAAQSCILHCFDEFLGVEHTPDKVSFLKSMRSYMLPKHREFIGAIQKQSRMKDYLQKECSDDSLIQAYNECISTLTDFRSYHLQIAAKYIVMQSKRCAQKNNYESVSKKGTGGTQLMPFLKDLRNTTKQSIVDSNTSTSNVS